MKTLKMRALATACALVTAANGGMVSADGYTVATPDPAPTASIPDVNWTGFYGGLFVGHGNGDSNHCDQSAAGNCSVPPTVANQVSTDPSGAVFGIMAGYNYQMANDIVLGIEFDYAKSNMDATSPSFGLFSCGTFCTTDIENMATLRVRAGYAVDNLLPYVTAGIASTEYTATINGTGSSNRVTSAVYGVGLEYMLNEKWTVRGEFLQVHDPGLIDYDVVNSCLAPGCAIVDNTYRMFRFGATYRF